MKKKVEPSKVIEANTYKGIKNANK